MSLNNNIIISELLLLGLATESYLKRVNSFLKTEQTLHDRQAWKIFLKSNNKWINKQNKTKQMISVIK